MRIAKSCSLLGPKAYATQLPLIQDPGQCVLRRYQARRRLASLDDTLAVLGRKAPSK